MRQSINTMVDEVPDHEDYHSSGPRVPPPQLSIFLNTLTLQPDVIQMVCKDYLDIYDTMSLGITCKTLYELIFKDELVWTDNYHRMRQLKLFGRVPFLPIELCFVGTKSRDLAKLFVVEHDGATPGVMKSGEIKMGTCRMSLEEATLQITAFPEYLPKVVKSGLVVFIDHLPADLDYKHTKQLLMVAVGFTKSQELHESGDFDEFYTGKMMGKHFVTPDATCKRWIAEKIEVYRNQALPQSKRIWSPKFKLKKRGSGLFWKK